MFLCAQIEGFDAVLPRVEDRAEPLHAIYAPPGLPIIQAELQNERARRIERVLAPLSVRWVEENELRSFDPELNFLKNINTPEEARRAGFSL